MGKNQKILTPHRECVLCFSCARGARERLGDPAEGALRHGDLERPSGRRRHRLLHLAAGTGALRHVSRLVSAEDN